MTDLRSILDLHTVDCSSYLDLCAGPGAWLAERCGRKIAIEMNDRYNGELIANGYDLVINADVADLRNLRKAYRLESECLLWIDGIEHLPTESALAALAEAESMFTRKFLVFTPNEFIDNKHNARRLGEPLQEHLSLFPREFWSARGYREIYREYNEVEKVENVLYLRAR